MLRGHFPHLITRIFEVGSHSFVIFFDKDLQRADLIAEEFDDSIRPVTVPVTLSNSVPQHYSIAGGAL